MKRTTPPRWLTAILRWFCREDLIDTLLGDLEELFERRVQSKSLNFARYRYFVDVILFLRPFALKRISKSNNSFIMLQHYAAISFRKFWKRPGATLTKVFSLTTGLISLFFILLYVHQEFGFDDFHSKKSKIFRLNTKIVSPTGDLDLSLSATGLADYLKNISPEIESFVRINQEYGSHAIKVEERIFSESGNILYVDQNFFDLFDFELLKGNEDSALKGPNKILLTESMARKYFVDQEALNQTIYYDEETFVVSGILKDIPSNSQLQFDFLVSMETFLQSRPNVDQNWTWLPMNTYVLLKDPTNTQNLKEQIEKIPQYLPENNPNEHYVVSMEPFEGIHFSEAKLGELGIKGNWSQLVALVAIAIMIVLLSISNFINLSTAQISTQFKEVSVKKALGASRNNIFKQFIWEAAFIVIIACLLSGLLTTGLSGQFEQFLSTSFSYDFIAQPLFWIMLMMIVLVLVVLSGIYPAMKFSKLSMAHPEKESKPGTSIFNSRTSLLVFQFWITSILITGSVLIYQQIEYLNDRDLGIKTDQKLIIEFGPNGQIGSQYRSLTYELEQIPGVNGVTFSSHIPGEKPNGVTTLIKNSTGEMKSGDINLTLVDDNFLTKYGLELIAGRDFRVAKADSTAALIVNESCARAYGFEDINDIIGKSFEQWGGDGTVIGVVSDFNYLSLHEEVGLLSLKVWPQQFQKITVDLNSKNMVETIKDLEDEWTSRFSNIPFNSYFLDDSFRAQYEKDEQFATIIKVFTGIALAIGLLGLVSFASFWCNRRKKEFSIRKVLGANDSGLTVRLYRQFSVPVLIGFILAVPITYILGKVWLEQFAYQIEISAILFLIPFILLLGLIWIGVGYHIFDLIRTNPVEHLKEE